MPFRRADPGGARPPPAGDRAQRHQDLALRNLKLVSEPELERLRSADDLRRMHDLQMLLEMRDPPKATEPPNPRFVGLALEVFRRDKITRAKLLELLRLAGLRDEALDQLIETAGVDDDTPHGV